MTRRTANGDDFDPFLHFIEHMLATGFVREHHRQLLQVADEPRRLLQLLADRHARAAVR
jgi:predicted Rossmann-fold nucleotide-binding protein